jgi:hypothetical protein
MNKTQQIGTPKKATQIVKLKQKTLQMNKLDFEILNRQSELMTTTDRSHDKQERVGLVLLPGIARKHHSTIVAD